jgi:hypothetical protein
MKDKSNQDLFIFKLDEYINIFFENFPLNSIKITRIGNKSITFNILYFTNCIKINLKCKYRK